MLSSGSIATVTNSTFAHNDGSDSSGGYGALDASDASAGTVIQNNTFYDNVRPLSISVAYDLDNSNTFSNPNDSTETNTYNGIFVESINHITSHITWSETEVPYVIDDNDFWINSGATLTLEEDVALKFRPDSVLLLADGTSQLITTQGINDTATNVFTSYKDDTVKGDTNADSSATSPADGDWGGIPTTSAGQASITTIFINLPYLTIILTRPGTAWYRVFLYQKVTVTFYFFNNFIPL